MESPNSKENLTQRLHTNFPFEPTDSQKKAFDSLGDFLTTDFAKGLFILRGYAGTGKTTVIRSLIASLYEVGIKSIQLAPTGRAAKVISQYTNYPAYTIHKKIFYPKSVKGKGLFLLLHRINTHPLYLSLMSLLCYQTTQPVVMGHKTHC